MLKLKKFPSVIIILILAASLNACAASKAAFGPESGIYEIMLDENIWSSMDSESIHQLWLLHQDENIMSHGFALKIDSYRKSDAESLSVQNFEGFIRFYKTFGEVTDIYEGENNSAQDLLDINTRDIRGGSATSGKRQQIKISNPGREVITEFIFLESDDYYFALSYGAEAAYFNKAQSIVNDVIRNLRVLK